MTKYGKNTIFQVPSGWRYMELNAVWSSNHLICLITDLHGAESAHKSKLNQIRLNHCRWTVDSCKHVFPKNGLAIQYVCYTFACEQFSQLHENTAFSPVILLVNQSSSKISSCSLMLDASMCILI